jgi:hypothetical protein
LLFDVDAGLVAEYGDVGDEREEGKGKGKTGETSAEE